MCLQLLEEEPMETEGPTLRRNDRDKSQKGSFSEEGPLSQDGQEQLGPALSTQMTLVPQFSCNKGP